MEKHHSSSKKKVTWVKGNPSRVPESVVAMSKSGLQKLKHPLDETQLQEFKERKLLEFVIC